MSERIQAYEAEKRSRDESIHNLIKLLDKRQARIKALESLVRDMDIYCRGCIYPCFAENGSCRIITRIEELLGTEVSE